MPDQKCSFKLMQCVTQHYNYNTITSAERRKNKYICAVVLTKRTK